MGFDWNGWLNIILRWVHVFAGIMWVGATYFFTWLDGRFHELEEAATSGGTEKHVWMVHSGGFYVVEKQAVPKMMTMKLHWFKWEAMTTWLSGMSLLVLVYYTGGLLADAMFDETTSTLIGLGSLAVAWFIYDAIWNSSLAKNNSVAVVVSFLLAVAAMYFFSRIYGGRTAYIQTGAMFGTLMAMNVWVRIIPGQQKLVAALKKGEVPDLTLSARAKARSKHNTFMVVPVVFTMISNHYPTLTYGTDYALPLLVALVLVGWIAARFLRKA